MTINVPMNDLSRALQNDKLAIKQALERLLESGMLVLGPEVKKFETNLANFLETRGVVGVASGTDALEIALKATMPEGKKTVLTAANAGGYTSVAAKRASFELNYADIDANTQSITLDTVQNAISPDVGVVVVTHLYGLATDITDLVKYCNARGVKVIEDCAQSLGAKLANGKHAGTQGDVGTTSFYPTKNLGALGDGGAVFSNSQQILDKVTKLRQYGWESKYVIEIPFGTNSRLDEIQASILNFRLLQLEKNNEIRRNIIKRYCSATENSLVKVLPAADESHTGHLAVAITDYRDKVRDQLRDYGIQTDIHYPVPDYMQPGLATVVPESLTTTDKVSKQIFSLPCFPELTEREIQHVVESLRKIR